MKSWNNYISVAILLILLGCDDFVEVDQPHTELVRASVFEEPGTAEAAVVELYRSIWQGFAGGNQSSLTALTGLSSDELDLFISNKEYQAFNENEVLPNNLEIASLWTDFYRTIYQANAIIEGLATSNIHPALSQQLRAEALFIRAYAYFIMVNIWGEVPLVTGTDYLVNTALVRVPVDEVYDLVIQDLRECQASLPEGYLGDRVRANQSAATALLARVYLYLEDWNNAEIEASKVIDSDLYALEPEPNLVFRTSSREAILQLWHSSYPREYVTFRISAALGGPIFASLTPTFIQTFSADDLRYIDWVAKVDVSGTEYFGVWKYKSNDRPPIDYSTVLRLAEQYLIRAEARVQQDKLAEAVSDLNIIRARAGLPDLLVGEKSELLEAIYLERKHELFAEQGHRWLDLKRTGRVDEVMSPLRPSWGSEDSLYPIPESQIISNPEIIQNPVGS
ncbi:MAG TPA: RagB/SusD family nutrient uptake outer membrane protein [Cyclobacteriaceae bacterium]|nr:RagB/SusD family nutrient uptake outer membrane protein [Cyclobacteriaceae bacterium]